MLPSWLNTALFWLVLSLCVTPSYAEDVLRLTSAQAITLGHSVDLPHQWSHDPQGMLGIVHYRLSFPTPPDTQSLQALYLPHIGMAAQAKLNGQLIGSSGFGRKEVGRYFHSPVLYTFHPSFYVKGENILDIEVQAYANRFGSLDPVYVGDAFILQERFDTAYFQNHSVHIIGTGLAIIYVLLLMPVWLTRRDSMFGWFIAGATFWAINGLNFILNEAPIPTAWWEWIVHVSVGLVPLCFSLFIFRMAGERYPRLETTAWISAIIIAAITAMLAGKARFFSVISLWQGGMMLIGAFALYRLFVFMRRNRDNSIYYIAGALGLIWLLAAHDLIQQQLFDGSDRFWLNLGSPLLMLAMGLLMVKRFLSAVSSVEDLNATLEKRVATAQASLSASYEELRVLEMERAVQEERERIYRNLHDDVGAKLLGLVISAQRSNQSREADLARSALQDLRDVVSRSAHPATPLANLVADWHAETQQRAEAAQITLSWQEARATLESYVITSEAALNLSRILREAVSNVLRHAQAKKIFVSVQITDGKLLLDIADDGVGIDPDFKANRGISSMLARANAMQGSLTWEPANKGCALHLCVPLASLISSTTT